MSKRAIRDVANTLPHMFSSRISNEDFEVLAALPDGTLTIDLLAATAHHDAGAALKLSVAETLAAWLKDRLVSRFTTEVVGAMIVVVIRTDRVPTDRARIIPFEMPVGLARIRSASMRMVMLPSLAATQLFWNISRPISTISSRYSRSVFTMRNF